MRTSTPDLLRTDDRMPDRATIDAGETIDATIDGEFVVEAPSVAAAIADVEARTGRTPEVIDVERLAKGGIGGFFAREVVRVRVRVEPSRSLPHPTPQSTGHRRGSSDAATIVAAARERIAEARPMGVDSVLQAMTQENDARERDFEAQLRLALSKGDTVRPADVRAATARMTAAPAVVPPPPAPVRTAALEPAEPLPLRALFASHPEPPAGIRPWEPARIEAAGPARPAVVRSSSLTQAELAPPAAAQPVLAAPDPIVEQLRDQVADDDVVGELLVGELVEDRAVEATIVVEQPPASRTAPAVVPESSRATAAPVMSTRSQARKGAPTGSARAIPLGHSWSRDALFAIGLPGVLLDRLEVAEGADELTWLRAVSGAVLPWCRPLPPGSSVLVGPGAAVIGHGRGIPVSEEGGLPPYGGDVALVAPASASGRAWVEQVRGDRWLHVVAGGRGWEGHLTDDVRAVSLVGRHLMAEVLALCVSHDLVLGYLAANGGDARPVRLTPLDVALAVRDALPRAEGA